MGILADGAAAAALEEIEIRAGDTVICEPLTYPGLKTAASLLGVELVPAAMDEQGILRLSVASSAHPLQPLAEDYAGRVLDRLGRSRRDL